MGPRAGTRECRSPTPGATRADDAREAQVVSCDSCRMIAVDAGDPRRKGGKRGITYVDPKTLGDAPANPRGAESV